MRMKPRAFQCDVVHEAVRIYLRDKRIGFQSEKAFFVQCDQDDCQYVAENKPPCPLSVTMFSEEIEEREEQARRRKAETGY
jgi:hypothetical protein